MRLTAEQTRVLLKGIAPYRVKEVQGMAHVEGYDIRAMLIRVFNFAGFSITNPTPTTLIYEHPTMTKAQKPAFNTAYMAHVRITIHLPDGDVYYDGTAVGEATMPDFKRGDTHDMAIKTADTQALKRAAINLGDQFGLSLYNDGSLQPLVRKLVGWDETKGEDVTE